MKDKLTCPNGHSETFAVENIKVAAIYYPPQVDSQGNPRSGRKPPRTTKYICNVCGVRFEVKED